MELIAKIKDENLLFNLIHELGSTFYKPLGRNRYLVVYFSGTRFTIFEGKLSEEKRKLLEQIAWKVDSIEIDEINQTVKIVQKGGREDEG